MKLLIAKKNGSVTWYHKHADDSVTIQTLRDETKTVEENKALHNMTSKLDRYGDGRMVLCGVPHELTMKWRKRGWFEKGKEHLILNDPEARKYKVFG